MPESFVNFRKTPMTRRLRIIKYLLFTFLIMTSGTAYAFLNIARCVLIDFSGFKKVASNVYVSRVLPEASHQQVMILLRKARTRITAHYGAPIATPLIIVVASRQEADDYGINDTPGKMFYTPWRNYLVLNYNKKSIDVTAHELVHAEIVSRLGYFRRQYSIPTWFDEGSAMQVDLRPKYLVNPQLFKKSEIQRVMTLTSPKKFWSDDKTQNIKNYQAAKVAVAKFFQAHPSRSLYSLLAKIKDGKDFDALFQEN